MSTSDKGERLQKVLAQAGHGSRRQIEALIGEGRITVDGQPAQLGQCISGGERIRIDGKPVANPGQEPIKRRVLLYHKPEGEVTTRHDPEGRPTVFQNLPRLKRGRWVAVGRLDVNTSGLLLFTNDGQLAHALMHPSREVEREYAVRVLGEVPESTLQQLLSGVELDERPARFDAIADGGGQGSNHWYHVILREGRHREVRRLWESQGVTVSRLMRVRYGPITLPRRVRRGKWEELSPDQLAALSAVAGLAVEPPARRPQRNRRRKSRR